MYAVKWNRRRHYIVPLCHPRRASKYLPIGRYTACSKLPYVENPLIKLYWLVSRRQSQPPNHCARWVGTERWTFPTTSPRHSGRIWELCLCCDTNFNWGKDAALHRLFHEGMYDIELWQCVAIKYVHWWMNPMSTPQPVVPRQTSKDWYAVVSNNSWLSRTLFELYSCCTDSDIDIICATTVQQYRCPTKKGVLLLEIISRKIFDYRILAVERWDDRRKIQECKFSSAEFILKWSLSNLQENLLTYRSLPPYVESSDSQSGIYCTHRDSNHLPWCGFLWQCLSCLFRPSASAVKNWAVVVWPVRTCWPQVLATSQTMLHLTQRACVCPPYIHQTLFHSHVIFIFILTCCDDKSICLINHQSSIFKITGSMPFQEGKIVNDWTVVCYFQK